MSAVPRPDGRWRASPACHDLRQAKVHAAKFGLGGAIQLGGILVPPGLIGDQRGMQRIDTAEPLAVEEGCSVASAASVRPPPCCAQATSSGCRSCVRP